MQLTLTKAQHWAQVAKDAAEAAATARTSAEAAAAAQRALTATAVVYECAAALYGATGALYIEFAISAEPRKTAMLPRIQEADRATEQITAAADAARRAARRACALVARPSGN